MDSHDLNSDEGLEALLKGAKPAPLPGRSFTANVVAQLPAPAASTQPAWARWAVIGSVIVGVVAVLLNPATGHQVREVATQVSAAFSSSWNAFGLAFALLVGLWAWYGGFGSEESRD